MVGGGHRQLEHLEQSWLGGTGNRAGPGPKDLQTKPPNIDRSGKQTMYSQGAGGKTTY